MPAQGLPGPLRLLIVVAALLTGLAGCDRRTRHNVLTFFFTGVPPLEDERKVEAEESSQTAEQQTAERTVLALTKRYPHPLWAEGRCNQCHQTAASFSVPGVNQRTSARFKKVRIMPGQLVLPRQELCVRCHIDKAVVHAQDEGLWLHTAAAKGDCNKCHDPHQSDQPFLLLEKPAGICIPCHSDPKVTALPEHQTTAACLTCHNAHFGKDRKMLKKGFEEDQYKFKPLSTF